MPKESKSACVTEVGDDWKEAAFLPTTDQRV